MKYSIVIKFALCALVIISVLLLLLAIPCRAYAYSPDNLTPVPTDYYSHYVPTTTIYSYATDYGVTLSRRDDVEYMIQQNESPESASFLYDSANPAMPIIGAEIYLEDMSDFVISFDVSYLGSGTSTPILPSVNIGTDNMFDVNFSMTLAQYGVASETFIPRLVIEDTVLDVTSRTDLASVVADELRSLFPQSDDVVYVLESYTFSLHVYDGFSDGNIVILYPSSSDYFGSFGKLPEGGTFEEGYQDGYSDGYTDGKLEGFDDGRTAGYEAGYKKGSSDGYNRGFDAGSNSRLNWDWFMSLGNTFLDFRLASFNGVDITIGGILGIGIGVFGLVWILKLFAGG